MQYCKLLQVVQSLATAKPVKSTAAVTTPRQRPHRGSAFPRCISKGLVEYEDEVLASWPSLPSNLRLVESKKVSYSTLSTNLNLT